MDRAAARAEDLAGAGGESASDPAEARKELLEQQLATLLDEKEAAGKSCRVLSIAAGPAEEVFALLQKRPRISAPVEVFLFHQDLGALSFSFARLIRVVGERWQGQVRITHLHDSITH